MTSREGGFDQWLQDYSEKVAKSAAETAVRDLMQEQQKPKLKVV